MRHNRVIYLLTATVTGDAVGNQVEALVERKIYANEYSVSSSEFYNAALIGLKPSKAFEIYSYEYQDESRLKHDDIIYKITRTQARGDKLVLYCERAGADTNLQYGANLAALTIGTLALSPVFSGALTTYTATTANATTVITAVAVKSTATVAVKLNGVAHVNGTAATWAAGSNTVQITVTFGAVSKIYTVTVAKT
jgi:head-tail adaptor